MSQVGFSQFVGVPPATIEATENGRLPMSKRLARRIHYATGVEYDELLKGRSAKLTNEHGKKYTPKDFRIWQRQYRHLSKDVMEILLSSSLRLAKSALLNAARQERFVSAYCDIAEALESAAERINQRAKQAR